MKLNLNVYCSFNARRRPVRIIFFFATAPEQIQYESHGISDSDWSGIESRPVQLKDNSTLMLSPARDAESSTAAPTCGPWVVFLSLLDGLTWLTNSQRTPSCRSLLTVAERLQIEQTKTQLPKYIKEACTGNDEVLDKQAINMYEKRFKLRSNLVVKFKIPKLSHRKRILYALSIKSRQNKK